MKNRKGFTLIEVIAVIVILGLIVLIAVPFFQGSLETFREDYYKTLENNIESSSKNFFSDNRIYLPNKYLDSQKIDLNTLIEKKYIDDVKDYNGNKCDIRDSYVIVVKTGLNKYEYATCTRCSGDDYEHTDNIYCGEAWDKDKGFTEVIFDAPPDVYVYKGTSREALKEQVVVYPDIRRCLGTATCTKEIKRVNAKGDINAQPIYPLNLDSIDTNVVGEYPVTYRYSLQDRDASGEIIEKVGKVIVYEFEPADVTFTKYNTVYKDDDNNTVTDLTTTVAESPYNPDDRNDWAQKLNISFDYNKVVDGKKIMIARYQWYLNNRWEDYCVPKRDLDSENNQCDLTIGNVPDGFELDDNIKFRFVDVDGRISAEKVYNIRIDYTAPDVCELKTEGTYGLDSWYVSSAVKVSFASKDDKTTTSKQGGSVKSGINYHGVTKKKRKSNNYDNQNADTTGITWYGYIEDKAGNFTTCSIDFKKDSTKPTCTKWDDNTTWKNTPVTVYWGCDDATSECSTGSDSHTFNEDNYFIKTWTRPSYDIYDNAGNKKTCDSESRNIYYDKKAPVCINTQNSSWTTGSVTISWGCQDDEGASGCDPNYSGSSDTFRSSIQTSYVSAYTIKDNAGNSTPCSGYTSNVFLDTELPTCDITKTSTGSTSGVSVSVSCSDGGGSNVSYCKDSDSGLTSNPTYSVTDGAGNSNTCTIGIESFQCEGFPCNPYPCVWKECADTKTVYDGGYEYGNWSDETIVCSCSQSDTVSCAYYHDDNCDGKCSTAACYGKQTRTKTWNSSLNPRTVCVPGYTDTCYETCYKTCYR